MAAEPTAANKLKMWSKDVPAVYIYIMQGNHVQLPQPHGMGEDLLQHGYCYQTQASGRGCAGAHDKLIWCLDVIALGSILQLEWSCWFLATIPCHDLWMAAVNGKYWYAVISDYMPNLVWMTQPCCAYFIATNLISSFMDLPTLKKEQIYHTTTLETWHLWITFTVLICYSAILHR